MVNAVTERVALALLSASSAANQHSNRKNPSLLPSPLNQSEKTGVQRAPAILRFDTPRVSPSTFSALQEGARLSAVRKDVTLEERSRLEAEIRRRFQVIETGGSPGSPGTPASTSTTTITESRLDDDALGALGDLIEQFRRGNHDESSRFVPALARDLQRFSARVGSAEAGEALAGIIRRIENSVIGEDGLQFSDLFRDPALFLKIAGGLAEFSDDTNHQAAHALRDVILRLGDGRLYDGNPHNDSLQAISSAIDRLGDALGHGRNDHDGHGHGHGHDEDDHGGYDYGGYGRGGRGNEGHGNGGHGHGGHDGAGNAVAALEAFLDRIGGDPAGGINRYATRIADILDQTLDDLRGGTLDLQAIRRVQSALDDVRNLQDVAGNADDRLRQQAAEGLQDILDQYASTTTRTQTVTIPGEPAVPPTPGEKTLVINEETSLAVKTEIAQRVVTIYQSVQEQLKPLHKLNEPPPPVPNLQVLVTPQQSEDDEKRRNRFRIGGDEDSSGFGRGLRDDDDEAGNSLIPALPGYGRAGYGGTSLGSGRYLDSTI